MDPNRESTIAAYTRDAEQRAKHFRLMGRGGTDLTPRQAAEERYQREAQERRQGGRLQTLAPQIRKTLGLPETAGDREISDAFTTRLRDVTGAATVEEAWAIIDRATTPARSAQPSRSVELSALLQRSTPDDHGEQQIAVAIAKGRACMGLATDADRKLLAAGAPSPETKAREIIETEAIITAAAAEARARLDRSPK